MLLGYSEKGMELCGFRKTSEAEWLRNRSTQCGALAVSMGTVHRQLKTEWAEGMRQISSTNLLFGVRVLSLDLTVGPENQEF